MTNNTKSISSGLEDYIETIYVYSLKNEYLKGADLARILNISRASVSEALSKLVSKGLIKYNSYEVITLTQKGFEEGKSVYSKHHTLKDFFETVLNVESTEAGENACKIEHIVSKNILTKMEKLTNFFKKHKKLLDVYIEESEE